MLAFIILFFLRKISALSDRYQLFLEENSFVVGGKDIFGKECALIPGVLAVGHFAFARLHGDIAF
ncbi:MAG: hypothetical protein PHE47_00850 [Oscillospiraceae bacterium]|nr:hypothetical protein [Oscillospiraceae bacterium]